MCIFQNMANKWLTVRYESLSRPKTSNKTIIAPENNGVIVFLVPAAYLWKPSPPGVFLPVFCLRSGGISDRAPSSGGGIFGQTPVFAGAITLLFASSVPRSKRPRPADARSSSRDSCLSDVDSSPEASSCPLPQISSTRLGSGPRRHTLQASMYRIQRAPGSFRMSYT
jgi:hypothetical protein